MDRRLFLKLLGAGTAPTMVGMPEIVRRDGRAPSSEGYSVVFQMYTEPDGEEGHGLPTTETLISDIRAHHNFESILAHCETAGGEWPMVKASCRFDTLDEAMAFRRKLIDGQVFPSCPPSALSVRSIEMTEVRRNEHMPRRHSFAILTEAHSDARRRRGFFDLRGCP